MKFSRALRVGVALGLVLPLLMLSGPAWAGEGEVGTADRVYVTDLIVGTVSVVDAGTKTIVATIPVGGATLEVTASPDGSVVYVSSAELGSVSVIDTGTNTVVATIPVGSSPSGIAFSPDGATAYVVDSASDTVSVIDTASRTVTDTIPLAPGSGATEIAVSPDGSRVYVTNTILDTVSVIETATNTVIDIPVAGVPYGVAVSPDGSRVYVTRSAANDVAVIDTATNSIVASIPVGLNPKGIEVGPEGSKLYVANADSNTVSFIDTATNTVTATIHASAGAPLALAVTSRRVYVSALSGAVVIIDRGAEAVIGTVEITSELGFSFPWGVAVVPGTEPAPVATPSIATQASGNTLQGGVITDTATLSGGASPTGEVIFRLYDDPDCLNEIFTSTNPLVGGTATSNPYLAGSPGTYYWRAIYTGDANNNPAANPCNAPHESVVVSPFAPPTFTRTITGDFAGPLTVNAGESVQLSGARVSGPVVVNPGGALTILNSQVSGGIITTAPSFLMICGSQIAGQRASGNQGLRVFDSTVPIRIGDAARGCPGNRFSGNVELIDNVAVTFGNNIVAGSVTVNDNGPGETFIKSNNITGMLACAGNEPPPRQTRPAERNTAGSRSGQCSGVL
ncbi:MAG: beta-propeller fold lactonase family protein [Actinomycetota bacterium]|nr:beta-propeller fold lactonase family protein [Actinomycetota bacterium]